MKMSILNRIIFLLTGNVAGYKIIGGMDNYSNTTTTLYTISFGLLLLASLLLLLMGFEIMENDYVAVVVSVIPITLSLGLVTDKLEHATFYTVLITGAFIIAVILRFFSSGRISSLSLGAIHLLAGTVIVILPVFLFLSGKSSSQILLISLGGSLIGVGGTLLGFLKADKLKLQKEKIYALFPALLFFTTTAFVLGLYT
jgi:hypothetical protein